MALSNRFLNWLWSTERRRAKRKDALPLEACYWDGAESRPRRVKDVSIEGMYLLTEQRWYPNTLITMALTRTDREPSDPMRSIRVVTRAVRSEADGVGLAFVYPPADQSGKGALGKDGEANRKMVLEFLDGRSKKVDETASRFGLAFSGAVAAV